MRLTKCYHISLYSSSSGHVNELDSLFDPASYSIYNEDYMIFVPTFSSDITEIPECNGDLSCIYDAHVTGDLGVGLSSLNASMGNTEFENILSKWSYVHNLLLSALHHINVTSIDVPYITLYRSLKIIHALMIAPLKYRIWFYSIPNWE